MNIVDMIDEYEPCDHCGDPLGEWQPATRSYCGNEQWGCFDILHTRCVAAHREKRHGLPDTTRLDAWEQGVKSWHPTEAGK